jgi:outer membrane immunogenic protein
VFGVAADYSWSNITGSSNSCGVAMPHSCGTTPDSFGTPRGRFGYAAGPNGMPYVTSGLAVGEVQAFDSLTPASGSAFRTGWTVGAGIEALVFPHVTLNVEYLYMDLGSAQLFNIVLGVPETVSFKTNHSGRHKLSVLWVRSAKTTRYKELSAATELGRRPKRKEPRLPRSS